MDETDEAQSPLDLFFILAELKAQEIDVQTIAPKFTGLFAKGIDLLKRIYQDVMVWAKHPNALLLSLAFTGIHMICLFSVIFLLLDGLLTVRIGEKADFELAKLYPGEITGEISFLDSRPPNANCG